MHPGAGAYICGDETALHRGASRASAASRGSSRPFFPAVVGLYGEPTVVNNVETHVERAVDRAQRRGGLRRARRGALDGHAALRPRRAGASSPGVYEIEMVNNTFRDLIYDPALGGGTIDDGRSRRSSPAASPRPWFGPDLLDLPLGQDEVAEQGSMLGSGSVVVIDETTAPCARRGASPSSSRASPAASARRAARARAGSSARCTASSTAGGRMEDVDLLLDLCDNIAPGLSWPPQQTTICVLGPSIPSSMHSAISMFRDEFAAPRRRTGGAPMTDVNAPTVSFTLERPSRRGAPGELVIEAAERAGTYIPRFCYHPRMEPVGHVPHVPRRDRRPARRRPCSRRATSRSTTA